MRRDSWPEVMKGYKPRDEFHRDDHLPARRRRRRDCLIIYGLLALAVALWIPLILMVTFGWGAV